MPSLRFGNWTPMVIRKHILKEETESIDTLCRMTMDSDGEYSSLLLAERLLNAFEKLDGEQRLQFFTLLHQHYDIDIEAVKHAIVAYERLPDHATLQRLDRTAEPARQELLRRINLATRGTARLVKMREHLLALLRDQPALKKIDNDFHHLFNTWFNRSFLMMQPIDWTTSAHILEKIIAYEAVHEIKNWDELRSRLQPSDRYCYGFFHPSMIDEPLVFVEVALTREIPTGIDQILHRSGEPALPEQSSCAIFYSISTCHRGLSGVSFGNFLIKQVATSLKLRFPDLKTFSTISPIPGFSRWMKKLADRDAEVAALIDSFDASANEIDKATMHRFAATYLVEAKNVEGLPLDPVARFHLKNGAILERINILGDTSENGMKQSFGTMVNYVYDLSRVEENHEAYMQEKAIVYGSTVKKLLSK